MTLKNDEYFMARAIAQAKKALAYDEVPVGAVVVREGKIIARAHNLRETKKMPTAHAELLAMEKAAKKLGGWRLIGCTLYVTLEPCPMCAGTAVNARIPRIVFGAYDQKAGAMGSVYTLQEGKLNHTPEVLGGILAQECAKLLSGYFKQKRGGK